jgi:hypothetical protein
VSRELNGKLLVELGDQMQVNQVPAAERMRMREALLPLVQRYQASLDDDLVASFQQELDSKRAR